MSCNTFIPIMDLVREVEALLAANYIDKDDPRITGGVFTNPTIKEGFLLDVQAREEFCRLVQECGLDAPFGKMWLSRPLYPDQMFVSYEDSGEPQTKWKTIQAVLESAGVLGPQASSLSSRLAAEIERSNQEDEIALADREAIRGEVESVGEQVGEERDRAILAESALEDDIGALQVADVALQDQINSVGGGKRAYATYALMDEDKLNIPTNASIDVINDPDPLKNGTYSYDGSIFTLSPYDPQAVTRSKVVNAFDTLATMNASNLPAGTQAYVSADVGNNGLYKKVGGAWVKASGSPLVPNSVDAVLYSATASAIRISTTDKTLVTAANGRLIYDERSTTLPVTTTPLPDTPGVYRVEYVPASDSIRLRLSNAPLGKDSVTFARLIFIAGKYTLKGVDDYEVDGIANSSARNATVGHLVAATGGDLNFNLDDSVLTIAADTTRLLVGPIARLLGATSLPLPAGGGWFRVMYNWETDEFRIAALVGLLGRTEASLGFFNRSTKEVYGFPNYSVNGVVSPTIQYKEGRIYLDNPGAIRVNTQLRTITTTSAARLRFEGAPSVLLPDAVIPLPEAIGAYRLVYKRNTSEIGIISSADVPTYDEVVFGRLHYSVGRYTVSGLDKYTLDGVVFLDGEKPRGNGASILAQYPQDLNFNFVAKRVEIAADKVRIGDTRYYILHPGGEVSWEATGFTGWHVLVQDATTMALAVVPINLVDLTDKNVLAYIDTRSRKVHGVAMYTIDGRISGGDVDTAAQFAVPYGNVSANYLPPELPALNPVYEASKGDVSALYALYDALVAANPGYITMTVLGLDPDGTEIRQYRFNAPDVPSATALRKPKIILCSNVHPEYPGTYNLYNSLRIICEDWETSEELTAIRWGTDLVVVPLVVPYNFVVASRTNKNGVDIARNFEIGWTSGVEGTPTYGGPAPLSEVEAQLLDGVMSEHRDAIAFASHHSFFALTTTQMPEGVFCWVPHTTEFGANLAKSMIMSATIEARKRYSWISKDPTAYLGYADLAAPLGSEGRQATGKYQMQGCTFETVGKLEKEPGQPYLSSAVTTLGAYCLINWILYNLRHTIDLYNSQIGK